MTVVVSAIAGGASCTIIKPCRTFLPSLDQVLLSRRLLDAGGVDGIVLALQAVPVRGGLSVPPRPITPDVSPASAPACIV